MTRAELITEARRWIGTPYVHQASARGAGCDCLGLIRGLWRAAYGCEPAPVPAYTGDWGEPARDELLWQAAATHLREKPAAARQPGDLLLFRMREGSVAKHVGLMSATAPEHIIHAYSGHGTIESPLSAPWARRIVACFDFSPEVP